MKKLRASFAVMVITIFGILAFSQEALASPYPKWIKATYTWKIVKVGKNKNKPGYYAIKIFMNHKNNNKNGKIITAIFDKTLELSYRIPSCWSKSFSTTIKASKVNKVEIYPGQSHTLTYLVPLKAIKETAYCPNYNFYNKEIESINARSDFKEMGVKINYYFQVRTE